MKIRYRSLSGTWIVAEVNTLTCKDFYATIHFRTLMPIYENRKSAQWQLKEPNKLSEKQWNTLLLNLYKKTKQKDSFDIRHRFLHFAQPTALKLKEIRQIYTDTTCPRCGEPEETHEHWMFSCKSSQKLHIYLIHILKNTYTENTFENTVTDCLLTPLLKYVDKLPIAVIVDASSSSPVSLMSNSCNKT